MSIDNATYFLIIAAVAAIFAFIAGFLLGRRNSGNLPLQLEHKAHELEQAHTSLAHAEERLESLESTRLALAQAEERCAGLERANAALTGHVEADEGIHKILGPMHQQILALSESMNTMNRLQGETHAAFQQQSHEDEEVRKLLGPVQQQLGTLNESLTKLNSFQGETRVAFEAQTRSGEEVLKILAPIQKNLGSLGESVDKLNSFQSETRAQLSEQLQEAQNLQRTLHQDTEALRAALSSRSARGYWGEVQLQRLLESTGMLEYTDFDTQTATGSTSFAGSQARPDVTVHLPGGAHLAIDAKAPFEALLQAAELPATATRERDELLTKHASALRQHVKQLADRDYPSELPSSPPITLLFLPAESMLSTALEADPALLEYASRRLVTLATPTTLFATLASIASLWKIQRSTEEVDQIVGLGKELTDRLRILANNMAKIGKALERSVQAYNSTVASFEGRVLVTVNRLDSLESITTPPAITADKSEVREITNLGSESE